MALLLVRKWLITTPLADKSALAFATAALALPTLYRLSLEGMVTAIGYCPYLISVFLSAVLLGWRRAAFIALASVLLADALFIGPRFQLIEGPTDMLGDMGFLLVSVVMIASVQAIRTAFEDLVGPTATDGVFFSVENDQAWASWPKAGFHLRLGQQDDVTEMMKDFIAQVELGRRLNHATHSNSGRKNLARVNVAMGGGRH